MTERLMPYAIYDLKPDLDIVITVDTLRPGGASLTHDLHDRCPGCNEPWCEQECENLSDGDKHETKEDTANRIKFNAAIEGMTSFLMALACEIDHNNFPSQAILRAAVAAYDAIGNEYS